MGDEDFAREGAPLWHSRGHIQRGAPEGEEASYSFDSKCILATKLDRDCKRVIDVASDSEQVLPIAFPIRTVSGGVRVKTDAEDFEAVLDSGHWHYLKLKKTSFIEIEVTQEAVVAKPVPMKQEETPKCVFLLQIDSLGQPFLDRIDKKDAIPNISRFMEGAREFTNAWSTGEWTLPVLASVFTGLHTAHHQIWKPYTYFGKDAITLPPVPLLGETFERAGYLTSAFSATQRFSPAYGFSRGIQQFFRKDTNHLELTYQTLERLRAFPDRSHFIVSDYMDVHGKVVGALSEATQTDLDAPELDAGASFSARKVKSALKPYDPKRFERRVAVLKELDFHLAPLFELLRNRYAPEDLTVVLTADHGTAVHETPRLMSRDRLNVALSVKSPLLETGVDSSLIETVDLFPSLSKLARIEMPPEVCLDGKCWPILGGDKKYVISELRFPNEDYDLLVRGPECVYWLRVQRNGGVKDWKSPSELLYATRDLDQDRFDELGTEYEEVRSEYREVARRYLATHSGD